MLSAHSETLQSTDTKQSQKLNKLFTVWVFMPPAAFTGCWFMVRVPIRVRVSLRRSDGVSVRFGGHIVSRKRDDLTMGRIDLRDDLAGDDLEMGQYDRLLVQGYV